MADLAGWPYWKVVSITGQAGAGTDYQVELEIGDSAGGGFHLEGHCTNFPQDIRITDDDGTTLLDHWVEDLTADPIVVHVEVKDDLGSNQDVRIYYGKSGETTASDGANTFEFFDDFNRANSGTVGNGWTESESGGGVASIESNQLKLYTNEVGPDSVVHITKDFQSLGLTNFAIDVDMKCTAVSGTNNNRNMFLIYDGDTTKYYYTGTGYISGTLSGYALYASDGTYYDLGAAPAVGTTNKYTTTYDTTNEAQVYLDGVFKKKMTAQAAYSSPFDGRIYQLSSGLNSTMTTYWDNYRVRKHISTPPAFSSAGAEQSAGHPTMRRWSGIPGMQYLGRRSW